MEPTFHNMFELLRYDEEAWRFYYALPFSVREAVSERANAVQSFSQLRACAERFLAEA